jgi:hypothetical protein
MGWASTILKTRYSVPSGLVEAQTEENVGALATHCTTSANTEQSAPPKRPPSAWLVHPSTNFLRRPSRVRLFVTHRPLYQPWHLNISDAAVTQAHWRVLSRYYPKEYACSE